MEIAFPTRERSAARPLAPLLLIAGVMIAAALIVGLVLIRPVTMGASATLGDTSYDQIEKARAQSWTVAGDDASYGQAEKTRSQIVLPNVVDDGSYDDVERIRSQAGT
jgi:hypothetical protein